MTAGMIKQKFSKEIRGKKKQNGKQINADKIRSGKC